MPTLPFQQVSIDLAGWAAGKTLVFNPAGVLVPAVQNAGTLGLVGDGVTFNDAAYAAAQVAMANGGVIDWGGPEKTYVFASPIVWTAPNMKWVGAAELKLVKTGTVCPLVDIRPSGINPYCDPRMTINHNAAALTAPILGNQVAFAYGVAVLIQAAGSNWGCRVLNSWDSGVAVGQVSFTGAGTAGSPLVGTQIISSPQGYYISSVYGENCGCGVHGGQFDENGKKGGVVNILTGSDGIVGSVTGKANFGGLIVDFGGGGEATIGTVHFTGTLNDTAFPNNGSGLDGYFGGGQINVGTFQSHNSGRMGLAISKDCKRIIFGSVLVHAAAKEGVVVNGGDVTGQFLLSQCGQSATNTFEAFKVYAEENVDLNVTVTAMSQGSILHKYGYTSAVGVGGKTIRGRVQLHAVGWGTDVFLRTGGESLSVTGPNLGQTHYGYVSSGRPPRSNQLSSMNSDSITLLGDFPATSFNAYFDTGTSQWRYDAAAAASLVRQEASGLTFYTVASGASGAAAPWNTGMRISPALISPLQDNNTSLGSASFRYSTVFAGTGTINTSDAREKTEVSALSEAHMGVAKSILHNVGTFKWLESVENKGEKARQHFGVTAQSVEAAFIKHGLSQSDFGLFCEDEVHEDVRKPDKDGTPGEVTQKPVLGQNGKKLTRKGLREGQAFWLALAYLAREFEDLKAQSKPTP